MQVKHIKLIFSLLVFFELIACKPRIEMDMAQWGDRAFITNVQIYALEIKGDFKLAEYYENNGQTTTGIRRVLMTGTTVTIDKDKYIVTIKIPVNNDLSKSGIIISHTSTKVEPLSGSPAAGTITNLSAGMFTYRLSSANGITHDWTIKITT